MTEVKICSLCQRRIEGDAVTTPKFSDSGAGPNLYRHPPGSRDCVAQPKRRGLAHDD